jgi:uncharacterized membrane protein
VLSLLIVLLVCFGVGVVVQTQIGRRVRRRAERRIFERLPGYALFRSLTHRLAGDAGESEWQPALVEIFENLAPAFIIEELDDGRYTVFVPLIATPLAGAVYIFSRSRVHLIDIPFTQAIQSISRWGAWSRDMVGHMRDPPATKSSLTAAQNV